MFTIASSWGVYTLTTGIMILILGALENRIRNKKLMVVVGYFVLALGALSFLLVTNVMQLFMVQIFNAIGLGIVTPAWKTVYSKAEDRGKETNEWAFYDGGNMILMAIGAFLGGFLITKYGFSVVFVSMFFIQIIAAIISVRLLTSQES